LRDGEIAMFVLHENGSASFSTDDAYDTYFLSGYEGIAIVLDVTHPTKPVEIIGRKLESSGETAVYFSVGPEVRIETVDWIAP